MCTPLAVAEHVLPGVPTPVGFTHEARGNLKVNNLPHETDAHGAGGDLDMADDVGADECGGGMTNASESLPATEVSGEHSPPRMSRNDSLSSSSETSSEGGWANRGCTIDAADDEGDDLPEEFSEDVGDGQPARPHPKAADGGDEDESKGIPWIHELHHQLEGETLEGGAQNLRFNTKARGSNYYPFRTLTLQLLWMFVHKFQISRETLRGLVAILQITHEDKGFDVKDLEGFNAEHF